MNNRSQTGRNAVQTTEKTNSGWFQPGQSGNPGGRPKKTTAELKAVARMKKLTPHAVDVVVEILDNEKASLYARLQAAEIIFNRAMGRPDSFLRVDNAEQSVQSSVSRLQSLFGIPDDEAERSEEQDENESDDRDESDDDSAAEVNACAG